MKHKLFISFMGIQIPNGPGFKVNKVDSSANEKYDGKKQEIHIGSYIQFEDNELFNQIEELFIASNGLPYDS